MVFDGAFGLVGEKEGDFGKLSFALIGFEEA
jgi:hypothetical protein